MPEPAPGGAGGGVGAAASQWAAEAAMNNPTVRQQVADIALEQGRRAAKSGLETAGVAVLEGAQQLRHYVENGPAGVSILCFVGGWATTIVGLLGCFNIGNIIVEPFQYILHCYLVAFGVVAIFLEADPERLQEFTVIGRMAGVVRSYQEEVFDRAKFLTELRGRGFFYLFVGTLAATQCLICLLFLVGLFNMLMGVICLAMSCGINPADHLPARDEEQAFARASAY